MKILFLSIIDLYSIEKHGIYTDLLREFRDNGHELFVVTANQSRNQTPTQYLSENKVHFLRVKVGNLTKTNILEKGISTIMLEYSFLRAIKKHLEEVTFDLILYTTPPITFYKVIKYIKNRDNARTYLLLKDIFPQNAVDLGMFQQKSFIYNFFRAKEKRLYEISDYIGCMSKANVDFVLKENMYLNENIIEICPNSISPRTIDISEQDVRKVREMYGVPLNKTIFVYGGNLGKPQGINFVIDVLKRNEHEKNSFFLIVGSGTEYKILEKYFSESKPNNSKLFSDLPKDEYDVLVNSCDVGLIFLDDRFTIPNFPSRILSYMQASLPVLAATDVNTDIGDLIVDNNFGYWSESGDLETFFNHVKLLCDVERRKKFGENSRLALETFFTATHSYEIIMSHFQELSVSRKSSNHKMEFL